MKHFEICYFFISPLLKRLSTIAHIYIYERISISLKYTYIMLNMNLKTQFYMYKLHPFVIHHCFFPKIVTQKSSVHHLSKISYINSPADNLLSFPVKKSEDIRRHEFSEKERAKKLIQKTRKKRAQVGVRVGAKGANILLLEDETLLPRW